MLKLPIDEILPQVVKELDSHNRLIVVAAPGAGKTTRLPPFLIQHRPQLKQVIVLQPRRVAARSLAARIAEEQSWKLGEEVGYRVRFEKRAGANTKIIFMTDGILLRRFQSDPFLEGVDAVIMDEFHERSIDSDVCLGLILDLQKNVRADLKLIVMSATIDSERIANFLNPCPVLESKGRAFPVEITYVDKSPPANDFHGLIKAAVDQIKKVALSTAQEDAGHILVFFPGAGEIGESQKQLSEWNQSGALKILPLHGRLKPQEQDEALKPSEKRKIILATNIAETSITIDGVNTVIDLGLHKITQIDWGADIERLKMTRISLASAQQRAGRAGRQMQGRCHRLWTKHDERSMPAHDSPEVLHSSLTEVCLFLADQSYADFNLFPWLDTPPQAAIKFATSHLRDINALDDKGLITPLGRELCHWPLKPRIALLMARAIKVGLEFEASYLAALLSEKDILMGSAPASSHDSDLLLRMEALRQYEKGAPGSNVNRREAENVIRVREQIESVARSQGGKTGKPTSSSDESCLKLILQAFPDRVCRLRDADGPNQKRAVMVGGRGVVLDQKSSVKGSRYFIAVDIQDLDSGANAEGIVRMASSIKEEWLNELFPEDMHRDSEVLIEDGGIFSTERRLFKDLVLSVGQKTRAKPEQMEEILPQLLIKNFQRYFPEESVLASWVQRYEFAKIHLVEHKWPQLDSEILLPTFTHLAKEVRSPEDLACHPHLLDFIKVQLLPDLVNLLNREVPEKIQVPSGNSLKITYSKEGASLSVRLQEVFGWTDTPYVCQKRVPITLHLLSPGYKPVQVTRDLNSFWRGTYHEVRKELRARYPKHSWPEDPLTAKAVAKGRPTR